MSTSKKAPQTIRSGGGPGASHKNADKNPGPGEHKPAADSGRRRSKVSGGGGEKDTHHSHDDKMKGGWSS